MKQSNRFHQFKARILGSVLVAVTLLCLGGCKTPGDTHPPHEDVSFGGHFVSLEDPEILLTVADGKFLQGTRAVNIGGVYHAHRMDADTYELHVSYEGRFEGIQETMIFWREGTLFLIKGDDGEVSKFKRAAP